MISVETLALARKAIEEAQLSGGIKYMGSKSKASDLPTPSTSNKGHMYTISGMSQPDYGHEYLSDATQWVDLGADLTLLKADIICLQDGTVPAGKAKGYTADGAIAAALSNKQDKLIAGQNITIAADGKTISATGGSSPECITLSFYDDGDTGVLTDEQAQILLASELNYIWLNGMHRLDFRYRDDNNNKATYSAVDTSSDGNKTHSVEINLTTKAFTVYHKTLQELISDLAAIRSGAALGATAIQQHQDISGKQDKLTAGTGIKLEGNTISADVRTYKAFPSSWPHTYGTTVAQFCAAVNASYKAGEIAVGDAFLGNINSPAFFNGAYIEGGGALGSAEVSVQIMTPFGQNCVQLLTTTSSNNAPYHWEYTYVDGAASEGWRCWSQYSYVNNKLSLKQDKLTAGENITIENNVISATGGSSVEFDEKTIIKGSDNKYSTAVGGWKETGVEPTQELFVNTKGNGSPTFVGPGTSEYEVGWDYNTTITSLVGTATEAIIKTKFTVLGTTFNNRVALYKQSSIPAWWESNEIIIDEKYYKIKVYDQYTGENNGGICVVATDESADLSSSTMESCALVTGSAVDVYHPIDNRFLKTDSTLSVDNDNKLTVDTDVIQSKLSALGGLKFVALTQAQYDALTTKDASTLYIIKNA